MNDAGIERREQSTVEYPPSASIQGRAADDERSRARASAELAPERLRVLALESGFEVPRLAERLGISQRHLQRRFQKAFGCAPREWLREARLTASRELLCSATSVKEVAYTLGFRQSSQFCRDFKARFGCTPAEWRRASNAEQGPTSG